MTHTAVIDYLSENLNLPKKNVRKVLDVWGEVILNELEYDERVTIPHIGSLYVTEYAERAGRNPRTGEPVTIKAHKVIKLNMGKEAKETLNR